MGDIDKVIRNTLALERDLKKNAPGITREITHEQWLKEGRDRFGTDMRTWKFVCPSCNHVASIHDYLTASVAIGAKHDGYVGYSCIGRLTGGDDSKTFKKAGGPCMYSGGGLVRLNPVRVIMPTGQVRDVFEWAPVISFFPDARFKPL